MSDMRIFNPANSFLESKAHYHDFDPRERRCRLCNMPLVNYAAEITERVQSGFPQRYICPGSQPFRELFPNGITAAAETYIEPTHHDFQPAPVQAPKKPPIRPGLRIRRNSGNG